VHSNWQRDPKMAGGQAGLTGPAMVKAVLNSFDGIRASKPGGSLAGRHSVAGSTVVVQPLVSWSLWGGAGELVWCFLCASCPRQTAWVF
jgi:hypothetical protein